MAASLHPVFVQPTDKAVRLWRYMNLAKFVWSLQRKALFFARADQLGDPYEGYYTRLHYEGADAYAKSLLEQIKGHDVKITADQIKGQYMHALQFYKTFITEYFVSSWHMNEHESAAMWRLYTSLDESICISTTYSKLWKALP